jgi:hypothetical protein
MKSHRGVGFESEARTFLTGGSEESQRRWRDVIRFVPGQKNYAPKSAAGNGGKQFPVHSREMDAFFAPPPLGLFPFRLTAFGGLSTV